MEPKIRYEYSYFVHTFVINERRYTRYLSKLLRDKRFSLKIFEKQKDIDLYTHFLPKIRDFLFKSFNLDKNSLKELNNLPIETRAALLAEYPCVTFEYNLEKDIHGKTVDENSIFFKIEKLGLVLFNTGICFLYLKTNIENSNNFSDLLDFNYKFKDINQEYSNLKNYDNIKIQASSFDDIMALKDFILEITGPNIDALKINLDVERFYTYSYACIEQNDWNVNSDFEKVKKEFDKFINVLPSNSSTETIDTENIKIVSAGKYAKFGISKLGVELFSSDTDINNYTVLPSDFEKQYFYTYILSLYFKAYLKKLNYEFENSTNIEKVRKKFADFTKSFMIQEITSDDMGSLIYNNMKETLEVDKIYAEVKNKYDILYREAKFEKNERISFIIVSVLIVTLIINILNFIAYFRR